MMTTMISKIVPTQAAFCRTKIYVTTVNFDSYNQCKFFYLGCVDLTVEMMWVSIWAKARYELVSLATGKGRGGGGGGHKSTCKLLLFPITK